MNITQQKNNVNHHIHMSGRIIKYLIFALVAAIAYWFFEYRVAYTATTTGSVKLCKIDMINCDGANAISIIPKYSILSVVRSGYGKDYAWYYIKYKGKNGYIMYGDSVSGLKIP